MRPATILRSFAGGPFVEVDFCAWRFSALLEINPEFADADALMRHLRRGRSSFVLTHEYRLRPEDTIRIAAWLRPQDTLAAGPEAPVDPAQANS